MGIAGFYAGVPAESVNAHLATALALDPYHYKAREFLSRIEARQLVAAGKITRKMGRSVKDAIAVTATVQEYEFLHLFGMQPLSHRKLDHRPVVAWECANPKGKHVTYYFDHSQTFAWAFELATNEADPKPDSRTATPEILPSAQRSPAQKQNHSDAAVDSQKPMAEGSGNPQRVWQSILFK
jgi:phage gpG-like protein